MDITRTSGKRVNAGQGELVTAGGNQTTVRKSWKTLAAVVLGLVLSIPGLAQAQYRLHHDRRARRDQHGSQREQHARDRGRVR